MKYFKNLSRESADFYVYGDIVDERYKDFRTGEPSVTEVDPVQLREELKELEDAGVGELHIYINSAGGSVFAASTMVSLLKRFRETSGAKIHSYIDGLAASAATYLLMVADEIHIYQNSLMMIHKPMTWSFGNADDLQKDIDTLNEIEENMMLPMYKSKATVDEDELRGMIAEETWFDGNPNSKTHIGNYFTVTLHAETREAVACASPLFNRFRHAPEALKNANSRQNAASGAEDVNYDAFDAILKSLKGE